MKTGIPAFSYIFLAFSIAVCLQSLHPFVINIPSITGALILSSDDDYREFVQRRGRILRKYKKTNKQSADIYDVVVLPSTETPKLALIELRRFYEYARLATNHEEQMKKLYELLDNYGLTIDDIKLYTEIDEEGELDE